MRRILGVAIVLIVVVQVRILESLTPEEICGFCVHAQKVVYGHFGRRVPSKRVLQRQLKHECRRLPKVPQFHLFEQ
ncbi:unnamed protein product [Anisakis simplex]|uniref:Saposin B-type domain-containing protein n=1 Tax=Anisakis simplex TaxID=6269 RepID=A0A0M3K358_ANISI|nr:unnamed protein product [Anisakis simplex]